MIDLLEIEIKDNNLLNIDSHIIAYHFIKSMNGKKIDSLIDFSEHNIIREFNKIINSSIQYVSEIEYGLVGLYGKEPMYVSKDTFCLHIREKEAEKSDEDYLSIVYNKTKNKLFIDRMYRVQFIDSDQKISYNDFSKILKIELEDNIDISSIGFDFFVRDSAFPNHVIFNNVVKSFPNKLDNEFIVEGLDSNVFFYPNRVFYEQIKEELELNKEISNSFLEILFLKYDISPDDVTQEFFNFIDKKNIEKENNILIEKINNIGILQHG